MRIHIHTQTRHNTFKRLLSDHSQPPTLFTLVTMQSSTSPLKGRNVTQPKVTRKVAKPLPSDLIFPLLIVLMAVTHTMYPCWPLQVPST